MSAAYDRLAAGYYNLDLKSVANPGGLSGKGAMRANWLAFLADLVTVIGEAAASAASAATSAIASLGGASSQGSSVTNVALPAVGATMTIVIQAGKAIQAGMKGVIARPAPNATTHACYGTVQSYDSVTGQLVLLAEEVVGAGTYAAWNFSPSGFGVPKGRTVTGGGMVAGGGDLTANRVLTVTAAGAAEARAGTDATKAMTAAAQAAGAAEVALAYSGSTLVTSGAVLDHQAFDNASMTLTQNSTLPNLTNPKPGYGGTIRLTHGNAGAWTLTLGSNWKRKGGATALSGVTGKTDLLHFKCIHGTLINYRIETDPS